MIGVDLTGSFHFDVLNNNRFIELTNERAPLRIYLYRIEYQRLFTISKKINRLRKHGGAVARMLSIDGSAAVLSQGCCRSTATRRCCRKGAVDRRQRGGAVAWVLSIDGNAAVLSVLS